MRIYHVSSNNEKIIGIWCTFRSSDSQMEPKNEPNIYASRNGVYIINLEKTLEQLDTAYAAMKDIAEKGGKVLFVGTKKQAQAVVVEEALRSGKLLCKSEMAGWSVNKLPYDSETCKTSC